MSLCKCTPSTRVYSFITCTTPHLAINLQALSMGPRWPPFFLMKKIYIKNRWKVSIKPHRLTVLRVLQSEAILISYRLFIPLPEPLPDEPWTSRWTLCTTTGQSDAFFKDYMHSAHWLHGHCARFIIDHRSRIPASFGRGFGYTPLGRMQMFIKKLIVTIGLAPLNFESLSRSLYLSLDYQMIQLYYNFK